MTSPSDILSEIEKAREGVHMHRTRHKISDLAGWSQWSRWEEGRGVTDDPAFEIEIENRVFYPCLVSASRRAEELQRRAEAAEALAERLKLEAQGHAMEARTANSTIHEIYQVVSGATGESGNWHGAKPIHEYAARMKALVSELQDSLSEVLELAERQWANPEELSEIRRARTLLEKNDAQG